MSIVSHLFIVTTELRYLLFRQLKYHLAQYFNSHAVLKWVCLPDLACILILYHFCKDMPSPPQFVIILLEWYKYNSNRHNPHACRIGDFACMNYTGIVNKIHEHYLLLSINFNFKEKKIRWKFYPGLFQVYRIMCLSLICLLNAAVKNWSSFFYDM